MYEYRVAKVLCVLSEEWQSFRELFGCVWGIEAKQLTGTLVALRNRGLVQSRRIHKKSGGEELQWRMHPKLAKWKG